MWWEYDQCIVLCPVAAYIGTDWSKCKGAESKFFEMLIEVIAPLIAESTIFDASIDKKIVHEWRCGDFVFSA